VFYYLHNIITFTPAAPQEVAGPGVDFLLGTITFTNGAWRGVLDGTLDMNFTLELTTHSTDSALNGKILSDDLVYTTTAPVTNRTPETDADFLFFRNHSELGSGRVYEEFSGHPNTGSWDVYGHVASLDLDRFANATGGAFLSSSVGDLRAVPEPDSAALLVSGLMGIGLYRRRSKRSCWQRRLT
jgi:hypothetical protein